MSGQNYVNETSSTSASGTLLLPVYNINDTSYIAYVYIDDKQVDSLIIEKYEAGIGADGIILQLILSLTIIGISLFVSRSVAIIITPFTLIIGSVIGLITIPIAYLIVAEFVAVLIALWVK